MVIIVLFRFLCLFMCMWWLLRKVLLFLLVVNSLLCSGLNIMLCIGMFFLSRVMDMEKCGMLCR